jgi:sulfane dehydrogenase subunit SoxC
VPYGERSRFEEALRDKGLPFLPDEEVEISRVWKTRWESSRRRLAPRSLSWRHSRHHPRRHRLLIHGMVERPLILTIDELRRLPSTFRILFLECAGNTRSEWRAPTAGKVKFTHGLTSCSEWTGVNTGSNPV